MKRFIPAFILALITFSTMAWADDPLDPNLTAPATSATVDSVPSTPPDPATTPIITPTPSATVSVAPITPPVVSAPPTYEKNELPPVEVKPVAVVVVAVNKPVEVKPRYRWAVADISCGVPSGCVGELGIRPFYWLKLEVGAGYNSMAPGVIGTIVLDPMPWAVGITASADVGHYFSGPVPFINNPPNAEYSWADAMLGLEMGNYRAWRFYLRGGLTWLSGNASNIDYGSNNSGATFGNPQLNIMAAPAVKIGFSLYF